MHALLKYLQTLQPFVDMKSDEKTRIALGSNGTQRTIHVPIFENSADS